MMPRLEVCINKERRARALLGPVRAGTAMGGGADPRLERDTEVSSPGGLNW